MVYTDLQKKQIQNGFDSGKYIVIYKQYDAEKYTWLTTSTPEWRWDINEYRLLIDVPNPPNESDMVDIYAYYHYPYLYYHEDNKNLIRTPIMVPSPYGTFLSNIAADTVTSRTGHIIAGTSDEAEGNNKSADVTIISPTNQNETFDDTNPKLIFKSSEMVGTYNHLGQIALQFSDKLDPNNSVPTLSLVSDKLNLNPELVTFKTPNINVTSLATVNEMKIDHLNVDTTATIGTDLTINGNLVVKGETKQVNTTLETLNYKRIEVDSTFEVTLDSADKDSILVGNKTTENLGIDANEIQARYNGKESTLYLNPQGGAVGIGDILLTYDKNNRCLRFSYQLLEDD